MPSDLTNAVSRGAVRLDDPATTLALLKLGAVVGLKGFFNSSGFATLMDVINHYDRHFSLGLTQDEKRDLVAFVASL